MDIINIEEYRRNKIRKDQAERLTNLEKDIEELTDKVLRVLKDIEEVKKYRAFQSVTETLKAVKGAKEQ